MIRSLVQRLPFPVARPFRFKTPAMTLSLAIRASWRTASTISGALPTCFRVIEKSEPPGFQAFISAS